MMNNLITNKVSVFRNLKNYKFSNKLTTEDKEGIVDKLLSSLGNGYVLVSKSNYQPKTDNMATLVTSSPNTIIVNEQDELVVDLFGGEIIEIRSASADLNKAYKAVKNLADTLRDKIELAYNDDYGYLMSDIAKIGSGYRFEADINLTAICEMNKVEQLQQNVSKLGYTLKPTNVEGVYRLGGMCNLGYSEHQVYEDFEKMVQKIDALELESAKMLDINKHDELVDRVRRSLAILKECYLLSQEELSSHINTIRLGLDLGITDIKLVTIDKIQSLIRCDYEFSTEDQERELAKKVNTILKGE